MVAAQEVLARAASLRAELVALRRTLHAHPEVGLDLPRTVAALDAALAAHGLAATPGRAVASRVLVIEGARPGPTVVLRADLDALPILEDDGNDPRSEDDGRMHACGHDLHAAMLVGAAALLHELRAELAGRVVCVFQPGEEGYEGMQAMLDEGLMDVVGPDAVASYALHVLSDTLPNGVFAGRAGVSHATSGTFEITIEGAGGHAAFPHTTRDPIPAAADLVTQLQVAVTRSFDVSRPVILTVGSVHAGDAPNVIPSTAVLRGTVRAFAEDSAALVPAMIERVALGVAAAHGVSARVGFVPGYPVVVNAASEVAAFERAIRELLGDDRFQPLAAPLPAGDDMGRLMQRVPGAFLLLGAAPARSADGGTHPNHSAKAEFDEEVMVDGAAALAWLALTRTSAGRP
ncbi:MAG: hypothetical protein BGO95_01695 [Micrococcales bacterium 73-13]|nr:MAG: hypothetical protein BGO95_01695 [Micrococcales bacterium 73-13]